MEERYLGKSELRVRKLTMVIVVFVCIAMHLYAEEALEDVLRKHMQGPLCWPVSKTANVKRRVRVIEYILDDPGRPGHGERRRLVTSLLDPSAYPAHALACAYHERWAVEILINEIDTHQRQPKQPCRSRTPLSVLQEFFGLLIARYRVRQVMQWAKAAGCGILTTRYTAPKPSSSSIWGFAARPWRA